MGARRSCGTPIVVVAVVEGGAGELAACRPAAAAAALTVNGACDKEIM